MSFPALVSAKLKLRSDRRAKKSENNGLLQEMQGPQDLQRSFSSVPGSQKTSLEMFPVRT
jgi:hypothetical protein